MSPSPLCVESGRSRHFCRKTHMNSSDFPSKTDLAHQAPPESWGMLSGAFWNHLESFPPESFLEGFLESFLGSFLESFLRASWRASWRVSWRSSWRGSWRVSWRASSELLGGLLGKDPEELLTELTDSFLVSFLTYFQRNPIWGLALGSFEVSMNLFYFEHTYLTKKETIRLVIRIHRPETRLTV